jgi:hypothetical protein
MAIADMLHHVQATIHDLCLVSIDFTGLATNLLDLKYLLSQNPRIKKIAMDSYLNMNELEIFDRHQILEDDNILNKFSCRTKPVQRSK